MTFILPWLKAAAAPLGKRRALLFMIPGGAGGFAPINIDLYRDSPAFRQSIDAAAAIVADMLGWDAAAAFRGEPAPTDARALARRNELIHLGLTRIAFIDQWAADGVVPDGALGVSLGEVIAPYAVGAISHEECVRLVTITAQAVMDAPGAYRIFLVKADHDGACRLCRKAPVPLHFLGSSSPTLALLLCREADAEAARFLLAGAVTREAPSGWPYHTPDMSWDNAWVRQALAEPIAIRDVGRPIYSPAVGALLPAGTRIDALYLRWMMTGPSHFAEAASAALGDGFDTFVQVAARPLDLLADVRDTAAAAGFIARQFHAFDASARRQLRRTRRRIVVPRGWAAPPSPAPASAVNERDVETVTETLLRPLLAGKPLDVVMGLADPIADAFQLPPETLARAVASSMQRMLNDEGLRRSVAQDPRRLLALADNEPAAAVAVRTLLRRVPDFTAFQPPETVNLGAGSIVQLMIAP
jgi:acyl transferase domain-containing protein